MLKMMSTLFRLIPVFFYFRKVHLNECGGFLTSDTGWISSPDHDFDGKYDHNVDCWWNITAGANDVIKFKFQMLQIAGSFRCVDDIVEVYDGDVKIFRYCDGLSKNPLHDTTVSNIMRVHFRSDDVDSKAGFNMTYSVIKGRMQECGGFLTTDTGSISSPDNDHDGKYDHNVDCWWNITAQMGDVVEFKFSLLEIDDSFRCMEDIIEIYDDNVRIFMYCDGYVKSPSQNRTDSNIMRVYFRSDDSNSKAGFNMTYLVIKAHRIECGGFLTSDTGWISSPDNDFDGKYDDNVDCWWTITAGINDIVEFKFSLLEIFDSFRCKYDFIEIYDDYERLFLYCGGNEKSPSQNRTSSNIMRVHFRSDDRKSKAGFNMTYSIIKAVSMETSTDVSKTNKGVDTSHRASSTIAYSLAAVIATLHLLTTVTGLQY